MPLERHATRGVQIELISRKAPHDKLATGVAGSQPRCALKAHAVGLQPLKPGVSQHTLIWVVQARGSHKYGIVVTQKRQQRVQQKAPLVRFTSFISDRSALFAAITVEV